MTAMNYTTDELKMLLQRRLSGVAGGFSTDEAFRRIEGVLEDAIAARDELVEVRGEVDEEKRPAGAGISGPLGGASVNAGMTGGITRGAPVSHETGTSLDGGQGSILTSDQTSASVGFMPTKP